MCFAPFAISRELNQGVVLVKQLLVNDFPDPIPFTPREACTNLGVPNPLPVEVLFDLFHHIPYCVVVDLPASK